ncbi:MAG: nuclear export factor [Solirubrobacteraceae bacterium]|nr:nuclear export factor [Solirubrobacteraceae bacterium]
MQLIATRGRTALSATVLSLGLAGVLAAQASAHAEVSPPTVQKGASQVFTLAVPTEEDNATTTSIVLTVPSGFGIDSFEAEPGWKRSVLATGSGEDAVVQKVTWTGGKTPTGEDSVFRFLADPAKGGDYTFKVQQTYSNGKIVDWSGPESADTPAPVIKAVDSIGGGGSSSTIGVIALIVAALALVLGLVGLAGGKRSLT